MWLSNQLSHQGPACWQEATSNKVKASYSSSSGIRKLVYILLEKGADVNAQGGGYGNALQAAAAEGHEAIVTQLLEKGADVNAQGGEYGNALQAAAAGGHAAFVSLLKNKAYQV
jgi:ankyrin repeat protein